MVVMLKYCCCGCTLKTGTLIIAVVFSILAALQVVIYSVAAVDMAERHSLMGDLEEEESLTGTPMPSVDEPGGSHFLNETSDHPKYVYDDPLFFATRKKLVIIRKWCMILLSLTETINFLLNILLMFAANKDSPRHVLIWVFGFFGTTCSRLLLLIVVVGCIFYVAITVGFILLSIVALLTVGAAYSLLVVLSYYRQLVGTGVARRISQQDD